MSEADELLDAIGYFDFQAHSGRPADQHGRRLLAAYRKEVDMFVGMRAAAARDDDDVLQTLGRALGYPWFKDDPANFPGATEANGVCVADHVPASIAAEAVRFIDELRAAVVAMKAERDAFKSKAEKFDYFIEMILKWGSALGVKAVEVGVSRDEGTPGTDQEPTR